MLQNMHSNIPYMFWLLGLSNVSLERLDAQDKIKQKPWKTHYMCMRSQEGQLNKNWLMLRRFFQNIFVKFVSKWILLNIIYSNHESLSFVKILPKLDVNFFLQSTLSWIKTIASILAFKFHYNLLIVIVDNGKNNLTSSNFETIL